MIFDINQRINNELIFFKYKYFPLLAHGPVPWDHPMPWDGPVPWDKPMGGRIKKALHRMVQGDISRTVESTLFSPQACLRGKIGNENA